MKSNFEGISKIKPTLEICDPEKSEISRSDSDIDVLELRDRLANGDYPVSQPALVPCNSEEDEIGSDESDASVTKAEAGRRRVFISDCSVGSGEQSSSGNSDSVRVRRHNTLGSGSIPVGKREISFVAVENEKKEQPKCCCSLM